MPDPSDLGQKLTRRQRQVLQQAALGRTNRQIGEALQIAEQTVKNHLSSAMRKMSLHDRTHAVVVAISQGWVSIPIAHPYPATGEAVHTEVLESAAAAAPRRPEAEA